MKPALYMAIGSVTATISSPCAAAKLQDLCAYEDVQNGSTARITWQTTTTQRSSYVVEEAEVIKSLFDVVRSFRSGWETPPAIWPGNATTIEVEHNGVSVCQIIYGSEYIYVALKDNVGFLRRDLSKNEYSSIFYAIPPFFVEAN